MKGRIRVTLGSKAVVCRALGQLPDSGRRSLAASFAELATSGPVAANEAVAILTASLFDPDGVRSSRPRMRR